MAQRLVRRLCIHCRLEYPLVPELAERLGIRPSRGRTLFRAVGCDHCTGTGYRGRTTIAEILPTTDEIHRLVLAHATASEIARSAVTAGMRTMQEHGIQKALAGDTTIEEVLSVTRVV